jgi:alpha-glucosidase
MDIKKALLAIRSLGFKKLLPILQYTLYKEQLDRTLSRSIHEYPMQKPGRLIECASLEHGARYFFEQAALEIMFLAPDLVRLSWEPGLTPQPYALSDRSWKGAELSRSNRGLALSSSDLKVEVEENGGVLFFDAGGNLLRGDLTPQFTGAPDGKNSAWQLSTRLDREEHIYGLGERAAPLNRRGESYEMWNSDPGGSYGPGKDPLYICIPVYMALNPSGSYLAFYENPCKGVFDVGVSSDVPDHLSSDQDLIKASFEKGMLRYYIIPGPPERALTRYSELTGCAPLPPRWVLGYHQCKWGYKSELEIRQFVDGFRDHELPLSAIHLDIDYMDGFRVFTVDKQRFPDLAGLSKDLDERGVRLVTIIDPGVKVDPDYSLYREGMANDAFCKLPDGSPLIGQVWPGPSVFPDFSDPKTRRWWGDQYSTLLEEGIAGFWHDMNEPASFTVWGDLTLPMATRHVLDGRPGDHIEGHNLYGLLMNRAGYEGLHKHKPERRPWIITRAGWAGMQRYAWNWTGDTETSWPALRQTIPTILGLGLSGIPFNGPDIGGFSGAPTAELYLRWFQLASFLPYFRTHSATGLPPREPWAFGEPFLTIIRRYLRLRYSLLPYIYTTAWKTSQTGIPPIRPLFWHDPNDSDLWSVDDAFYLGDYLLVTPVLEAGATVRSVRIPPGTWYDFWNDEFLVGPSRVDMPVSLEHMPLLVRAGSVLPMDEAGRLNLHVYPPSGDTAIAQLYSDAGEGYGPARVDTFTVSKTPAGFEILRTAEGDYPFPYSGITVRLHGPQPRTLETELFDKIHIYAL